MLLLREGVVKLGGMGTWFVLTASLPTRQMLARNRWKQVLDHGMALEKIEVEKSVCRAGRKKALFCSWLEPYFATFAEVCAPSQCDWACYLFLAIRMYLSREPLVCGLLNLFSVCVRVALGNLRSLGESQNFVIQDCLTWKSVSRRLEGS